MTRTDAAVLLCIPFDANPEEIRVAYVQAVKADHPDHGGAGVMLARLQRARGLMLATGPAPCKLCKGTGAVRARFGVLCCAACGGTGDAT